MAGWRTPGLSGVSLERRLPILISGLVALALIATLAVASHELRDSALATMNERLERAAVQVADLSSTLMRSRTELLRAAAADPAVRAFVAGRADSGSAAMAALERVSRGDPSAPVRLLDHHGRVLLQVPPDLSSEPHVTLPPADTGISDILPGAGDRALFRVTVPIRARSGIIGFIDQMRVAGSRALGEQVEGLLGGGIQLFFGHRQGGDWASLDGFLVTDAAAVPGTGFVFSYRGVAGASAYAFAAPLPGTDWVVVAEVPVAVVEARPALILRRIMLLGVLLLLLGALAARLVSRSVTRPIAQLAAAADAIALGDYSPRVRVQSTDEIGRLAGSFNAMLDQIETSHVELGRRFEQAQALALELEHANARLHGAIDDAETAHAEAQQASRAKSDFLATISHEIRTPINAMIGYTDLLEIGVAGELQPQQRDYVERVRVSGHHLIALVNDILDFAKIESGQLRVEREIVSAPVSINTAVSMFDARLSARRLSLQVQCALESVYLGDGQRVQQILLNLLSNAIKFTEPGGAITVGCDRRCSISHPRSGADDDVAEWTCITVADTGVGVPADQLQRIFEPFVQGSGGYTRVHAGTGLGLAISRSLARMMSGDLTVESTPGAGSSFTLWLPHPAGAAVAPAPGGTHRRGMGQGHVEG